MLDSHLDHAVLRAIDSLARRHLGRDLAMDEERDGRRTQPVALRLLLAVVPAPADLLAAAVDRLSAAGFIYDEGEGLRLSLRGFAAARLPQLVAHERRVRDDEPLRYRRRGDALRLRKAVRVA